MRILVTGKTGVGKTFLLNKLRQEKIIYMDDVVKQKFYISTCPLFFDIIKVFGNVATKNTIDTSKLGNIVLNNPNKLNELNKMVRPYVESFLNAIDKKDFTIIEMAGFLGLEDWYSQYFDYIILIENTQQFLDEKFTYLLKKPDILVTKNTKYDFVINNANPNADKELLRIIQNIKKNSQ